jgi:hypothetical protein
LRSSTQARGKTIALDPTNMRKRNAMELAGQLWSGEEGQDIA